MSVQRYGFTDVGRLDPIKTGRWCKAQDAIDMLAAKDAEIAALREALANIRKHCELMSRGDMYKMTSTWNIANKALEAGE